LGNSTAARVQVSLKPSKPIYLGSEMALDRKTASEVFVR
jgi:hypothetical protein